MNRGIYIVANDRVQEQAIALLNSIRFYDLETPVVLIPYDENYASVLAALQPHKVELFANLPLIESLSNQLYEIFGEQFFDKPNKLRKQACWFGPFDEFLYIDTDIVVFEKIIDNLDHLADYDFVCADYQHKTGIRNVFSPQVRTASVFTEEQLQDVFNSGFWAAKKNFISESALRAYSAECAAHPEYFDFSGKVSDQPILNYMVLKQIPRRLNLTRRPEQAPGNWAGSPHFQVQNDRLFDPAVNQPLQFLHWAGILIQPGCPYWDIWKHYRYLHEPEPEFRPQPVPQPTLWQRAVRKLKAIG